MKYEEIVSYCMKKAGAWEDYPFGPEPLVLKVSTKMFALLGGTVDTPHLSLKCKPETADLLRQQFASVKPGYHLNKAHWNTVVVDGTVPREDLVWMIDHSYDLVVKSLPKAKRPV
ncbi:MmcQ/YjbR family DNA-binding protein [Paenibacillus turpanensis]|uniref:MmcQ/YjbR family DNA-binding protein n=1 Tax=Paenibacillus turpanensis TaxID=2689078 RepID=UPI00140D5150|nr:MmcQ/YjbR family DNA-binding protein [Paenibacillus turpanensis]